MMFWIKLLMLFHCWGVSLGNSKTYLVEKSQWMLLYCPKPLQPNCWLIFWEVHGFKGKFGGIMAKAIPFVQEFWRQVFCCRTWLLRRNCRLIRSPVCLGLWRYRVLVSVRYWNWRVRGFIWMLL